MKIDGIRSNDRATEMVLAYYAAFNRGDRTAILAMLDDNVVHDHSHGSREIGKSAFAAFLQRRLDRREQLHEIVVMASPDGARAAAEYLSFGDAGAVRPRAGRSGRGDHHALPGGAFFAIEHGQIQRVSDYRRPGSAASPAADSPAV